MDAHDWAFANIARRVASRVADEFLCELHFKDDYEDEQLYRMARVTLGTGYDLVHFFTRMAPNEFLLDPAYLPFLVAEESLDALIDRYLAQPITLSVHDHLFLEPEYAEGRRLLFGACAVGYHVSSKRLGRIYQGLADVPPPDAVIEDGVDQEMFRPAELGRLADADRELVVGWAGNSRWNQEGDDATDYKGLRTIIQPAVETLAARGIRVRGHYRDRAEAWLPYADVPAYFATIDAYVCASDTEGTATPVLEAMACGLPVVSTDVGIVPELFGPRQREFLLPERSPESLSIALERLAGDPELRVALSRENLERIRAWTWEATAERWRGFFREILAHRCGVSSQGRVCCDRDGRRTRLREAAIDGALSTSRRLIGDQRILRDSLDFASGELEDAVYWANDVERRLAEVTAERDELRRSLVPWRVRHGARRISRAAARRRT
ncbi:MAG: glycosyltransferase family 4 protein [Actinomycetota bacterium]|nr:glycosyltransferase family 4 protein [Actinomycetota bacterium]